MSDNNLNERLMACPFCGSRAKIVEHKFHSMPNTYGIQCCVCSAQGGQFFGTMGNAVDAWNTRVSRPTDKKRKQYSNHHGVGGGASRRKERGMSYDLRLAVKVEGAKDCYAVVDEPEYASPTYNLRDMLVACMDWDYKQGKWYKVSDILPKIQRGINELTMYPNKYKKYNSPTGWGTVSSALESLKSLYECIGHQTDGWRWHTIPLDCLYMAW